MMGRKKGIKKHLRKNPEGISRLSTDTLLSRMQENIDSFQFEDAQRYCQEALKRSPDDVAILESAGSLCLELGEEERARHCYGRAITLCPEEGHSKYFTMAQLLSQKESLQCYLKGIEILSKATELHKQNDEDKTNFDSKAEPDCPNGSPIEGSSTSSSDICDSKENNMKCNSSTASSRELSLAFCSVAELFMTDLCDEPEAEEESLGNIEKAITADPQNPEAHQHMASFLLVKQKPQEAREYIKKSLEMWLPDLTAIDEGKARPGIFDPVEPCPLSYDTRLSTSRILIEVGEHNSACTVLEGLLLEDDQVIDALYLLGWNFYLQGDEHKAESKYHLQKALKMKEHPAADPQMIKHIEELLIELKEVIEEIPPIVEEDLFSSSEDEEETMDVT